MTSEKYTLHILPGRYAICQLPAQTRLPSWFESEAFSAIVRTEDELSIVCLQELVPDAIRAEKDWRAIKIQGPLDFSLVGVLAELSTLLAQSSISIFVLSTFDTDYIMVKDRHLVSAIEVFLSEGHQVLSS